MAAVISKFEGESNSWADAIPHNCQEGQSYLFLSTEPLLGPAPLMTQSDD